MPWFIRLSFPSSGYQGFPLVLANKFAMQNIQKDLIDDFCLFLYITAPFLIWSFA